MKIYNALQTVEDSGCTQDASFVYGILQDAKSDIKVVCCRRENNIGPIIEIIEKKAKNRLDGLRHLAIYCLNPCYYYRDKIIQEDKCEGCNIPLT